VRERVHAKCALLEDGHPQHRSVYRPTTPVIPTNSTNYCGQYDTESYGKRDEVAMLPLDDSVLVEVTPIGAAP